MSKKILYNGNVKWYKIPTEENKNNVKPVKLQRQFDNDKYEVFHTTNNNEDTVVADQMVIEEFIQYQNKLFQNNKNCINAANVLFRLKRPQKNKVEFDDNKIFKIEIQSLSDDLSKLHKSKGRKYTRSKLLDTMLKYYDSNNSLENFKYNNWILNIFDVKIDKENFNKSIKHSVLVQFFDDSTVDKRNSIINTMVKINNDLYTVVSKIISNVTEDDLDRRMWQNSLDAKIDDILNESNKFKLVVQKLEKLIRNENSHKESIEFINKYITLHPLECKLLLQSSLWFDGFDVKEGLKEYVKNLIKEKQIFKRVVKADSNENIDSRIKTYVENDRHIKKEDKINLYKDLSSKYIYGNEKLDEDLKKILDDLSYNAVITDVLNAYKKTKDTKLFAVYKESYKSKNENFQGNNDNVYKYLMKTVYRYTKGRVSKLIDNKKYIDIMSDADYIKNHLLPKLVTHTKNKMLDFILFEGKKIHEGLGSNVNDFNKFHATDQLFQETLALFTHLNYELNKMLKIKGEKDDIDFIGETFNSNSLSVSVETLRKFDFSIYAQDDFKKYIKDYLSYIHNLRSKVIHGQQNKWLLDMSLSKTDNKSEHYERLKKFIKKHEVSAQEISESLNISYVFHDIPDCIKKLNILIKDLRKIKVTESEVISVMPGFNKIVPEIRKMIKYGAKISLQERDIISNAVVYYFKILYLCFIKNNESSFMKKLIKKIEPNIVNATSEVIVNYYKSVQRQSAKGNYSALKKYQNTIIDTFLEEINNDSEIIMNFENVHGILESIKNKDKVDELVINNIEDDIKIENDFEFAILNTLLIVNHNIANIYTNRIRATALWLQNIDEKNSVSSALIALYDKANQINNMKRTLNELYKTRNLLWFEKRQSLVAKRDKNRELYSDLKDEIVNKYSHLKDCVDQIISYDNESHKISCSFKGNIEINGPDKKIISEYVNCTNSKLMKRAEVVEINTELDDHKKQNTQFDIYDNNLLNFVNDIISEKNKNIYAQGSENNIPIYKHSLFNVLTDKTWSNNFKEYYLNKINEVQTGNILEPDVEEFNKVDETLNNLRSSLKSKSKMFKERIVENIKSNKDVFKKYMGTKFDDYVDFEKAYNKKIEYLEQQKLFNFVYAEQFINDVLMINYELILQIQRFERDMHYLVKWLKKHNDDVYYEICDGKSVAFKKNKNHYKWNEGGYNEFKKLCDFFKVDLEEVNEDKKNSIRNYIAHFYIIRDIFNEHSIKEKIDEVNKFMSYRTLYRNSAIKATFGVMKRSVNIEYDQINRYGLNGSITSSKDIISKHTNTIFKLNSADSNYCEFVTHWIEFKK